MTPRDLRQVKIDRLASEMTPTLRTRGMITADAATLDDVDLWRAAARRAARSLGWRIRTGVNPHGVVWAASDDFPTSAEDIRSAMRRLDSYLRSGRAVETSKRPQLAVVTDSGQVRPPRPEKREAW